MSNPQDNLPKVQPFVQEDTQAANNGMSKRALLSQTTMIVSLVALTLAIVGGAKLAIDLFLEGSHQLRTDTLIASLVALGLAYLFGWILALASTRAYANLVMPLVIRIYTWITLAGIGALYVRIIFKLFQQPDNVARFPIYLMMLVAGMGVLLGLHLVGENRDLRAFSVPLLLLSLFQLCMIVYRYVFTPNAKPGFLVWDLVFFFGMLSISGLMLAHLGVLNWLRRAVDGIFKNLAVKETE
jgi:hypothetical protein